MAQAKKNISVIPATGAYDRHTRPQMKALRVAAYCRVSTLQEQQESSYEAQVSYYTEKIRGNPNWKLAGIYADDGKSATSTKKRSDFQTMIDDCMAGKIDMVLTKSISRFARNTVDALINIRKLKEKNIAVFFEKESINTLEGSGELLLTILSSQAQEESRNISENCHWGIVRKFEDGKVIVNHSKFMGYTKDDDGNLVIVPEDKWCEESSAYFWRETAVTGLNGFWKRMVSEPQPDKLHGMPPPLTRCSPTKNIWEMLCYRKPIQ